jgi:hypothetical protein
MKRSIFVLSLAAGIVFAVPAGARERVTFALYAESSVELRHARILVESLRTFGGGFKSASIRVYVPSTVFKAEQKLLGDLTARGAVVEASDAPGDSRSFGYAGKVFAAAKAEAGAAAEKATILVWMDEDTVILKEPGAFALPEGIALGYRPVMHLNIGSPYAAPPDAFWSRVYEILSVPERAVFPMKTVADGQTLRPYFNAGLLVVRPERGILKKWAESFRALYRDPAISDVCGKDKRRSIFLHQAALAGAILSLLGKQEMLQLPDPYNYPLFFKEMYGAVREFDTIDDVVTLRYESFFQNPSKGWEKRLKGPAAAVSWLRERFGREADRGDAAATKMRYRFQRGGLN